MAACGFGVIKCLDCGSVMPKLTALRPSGGLRTSEAVRFDRFVVSRGSNKLSVVCRSLVSEVNLTTANANVEDNSKDASSCDKVKPDMPKIVEVESFLTVLCDTTSINEVELRFADFQLHVLRNLAEQSTRPQPPVPAPIVETHDSNGSVASASLALPNPFLYSSQASVLLDQAAAQEGLVILKSPRVGYFRRSRAIKGKRTPPSCKEKDIVKEGQALCYIDQLGGDFPVESDISGEVVKILVEDGEPVGYGDALIAVLPSFPGIKNI